MIGDLTLPGNYLPEACKGCVVVHGAHPLILGVVPSHGHDPPYQWDPESKVFTVANPSAFPCFTYVTFCGVDVRTRTGDFFDPGITRDEYGQERPAVTFVVVVHAHTAVRLGRVAVDSRVDLQPSDFYAIELERLLPPPVHTPSASTATASISPSEPDEIDAAARGAKRSDGSIGGLPLIGFPLPEACGPYLCTQGVGGHLTHFFPESYHAIDLRCSCRTPVLSVGDGVVKEVVESHRCGGIHASNLAAWNAVSVRLDSGFVVEYLHTLPGSARVKVGDAVRLGQVICETGDIGFAPEPHLHIELHDADDADGPSLPFLFGRGPASKGAFVPAAGRWYSADGEASVGVTDPNGGSNANRVAAKAAQPPCGHRLGGDGGCGGETNEGRGLD
mmetsp:Transcript_71795/g.199229  ORF Transcript_71795/g.199229 Transcript_71795/m.199229 type:complete len:390 (+) Transcript_71795:118-1287(+)